LLGKLNSNDTQISLTCWSAGAMNCIGDSWQRSPSNAHPTFCSIFALYAKRVRELHSFCAYAFSLLHLVLTLLTALSDKARLCGSIYVIPDGLHQETLCCCSGNGELSTLRSQCGKCSRRLILRSRRCNTVSLRWILVILLAWGGKLKA